MKYLKLFEKLDPFDEKNWDEEETDIKTYRFYVHETNYGNVEVEAKNEEEAQDLANEEYEEGNVNWGRTNVDFNIDLMVVRPLDRL